MNCRDVAPTVCWAAKSPNTHTHTVTQCCDRYNDQMAAECWLQEVIHRQQMLCDHKQEDFCQSHESNCHAAAHVTEPHQGAFIIPGKLLLQPRGENNWLKLKLRLSRAASLITSEGFKVSSTSKASVRYSSSSVLFLLQRLLPRYMWYCNDYEFYQ